MNDKFYLPLSRASLCLASLLLSSIGLLADDGPNLIANPGFEDTATSFTLFTAPDSQGANCRFTISTDTFHSGKQSALMKSDDFARFSLGPNQAYSVVAGDLYRIDVWVKAGTDFQEETGSPGIVIRLNQTTGPTFSGAGLTFVYLNNTFSQADPPDFSPRSTSAPIPTEWTHVSAVVKVPEGVDRIIPNLFFWKAKGSLYVDDFSFQKVDASTQLSPMAAH